MPSINCGLAKCRAERLIAAPLVCLRSRLASLESGRAGFADHPLIDYHHQARCLLPQPEIRWAR